MASRKPTVLLADDHPALLQSVARLLDSRFDVVAKVQDGGSALTAASDLDPDFVVLDVSMPGVNGLEAAAALNRRGARAKVVLLTMHDDDDFIRSALAKGASGYVLKSRVGSDLHRALDGAQAGETFVSPRRHQVHFYATDDEFLDAAARFLVLPLAAGDPIVVVLTAAHRTNLALRLSGYGADVARASARGQYELLDVEQLLQTVVRDGALDEPRLQSIVGTTLKEIEARTLRRVTIVGEMVSLLCERGDHVSALRVERLWNQIGVRHSIQTLCAYAGAGLTARLMADICAEHSSVARGKDRFVH